MRNGEAGAAGTGYREAARELTGWTAGIEKRVLVRLAARVPARVTPDHLTALGFVAMLAGGVAYAASSRSPWLLLFVNLCLALNWFGDSLDGTLARHRGRLRPRYGFYVDHVSDVFGALFLLAGLAWSGHVAPAIAGALLVVYLLFSVNLYLATHTLGRFKMSYGPIGGTELRLLLAGVNLLFLGVPTVTALGFTFGLFDAAALLAAVTLFATLVASVACTAAELSRIEPA
jgi:archaetidylinositol phosphate synthase